jgi:molybdenum transport protein
MSFYIANYELEKIIEEDVSPMDLTSNLIELYKYKAKMSYKARHDLLLVCSEEAKRIVELMGLNLESMKKSGDYVKKGEIFFEVSGDADKIHIAWKTLLRIFEGYTGIATRTYEMVKKAKAVNPKVNVVTTRKNLAGTKKLALKAVVAGGAQPHRMGLSETVLIFDQHLEFVKDDKELKEILEKMKSKIIEKKIGIEAQNYEDGIKYIKMGFDFVQLDKFSPEELSKFVKEAKMINNNITLVAAGGITIKNIEDYAGTMVDVLVTSSLYFGKPSDIKVEIKKL